MVERRMVADMLRSLPVLAGSSPEFDVRLAPDDPLALFCAWLGAAVDAGVEEPHAVTVCTTAADGGPDARVLLLKDVDDQALWFATSRESAKGRQLAADPRAALSFHWPRIGRAVRARGRVIVGDAERNAADFLARGPSSRAVALASRVSEPLPDPADCDAAIGEARTLLDRQPTVVPAAWTTYGLVPGAVEFWQADPGRRHVRLRYDRDGSDRWSHGLLWP